MISWALADLALEGAVVGVFLSFTPGPALLSLIDLSMVRGRRAALWFAAGLLAGDATLARLAHAGMGRWLGDPRLSHLVGIAGAVMLLGMGAAALHATRSSPAAARSSIAATPTRDTTPFALAVRGALLNLLNPLVLAFWLSASAAATSRSPLGWALPAGCVVGTFLGDVVKIVAAATLRSRLRPASVLWMRRASAAALLAFGAHAAWAALASAPG